MALFNDVPVLMRSLLKTGPGMHSEDGGRRTGGGGTLCYPACSVRSAVGGPGVLCVFSGTS